MVLGGTIFFAGLIGFLQLNVTAPEAPNVPEKPGVKIGREPNTDPNAAAFLLSPLYGYTTRLSCGENISLIFWLQPMRGCHSMFRQAIYLFSRSRM
jgi:hypothetical protein